MKSTVVRAYKLQGAGYASRLVRPMSVRGAKQWLKEKFHLTTLPEVELF